MNTGNHRTANDNSRFQRLELQTPAEKALALCATAQQCLVRKDFASAISNCDAALIEDYACTLARRVKALALFAAGEKTQAIDCFKAFLNSSSPSADDWVELGKMQFESQDIAGAEKSFDAALTIDHSYYIAMTWKAFLLFQHSEYICALQAFEALLEIRPDDGYASRGKGWCLSALHKFQEAIQSYDKAFTFDPENTGLLSDKAKALYALGQWEEAELCWSDHLASQPNDMDAAGGCAKTLYARGLYQDALKQATKTLEHNPQWVDCLAVRALSLAALGKPEESLQACMDCLAFGDNPAVRALKDKLDATRRSIVSDWENKYHSTKVELAGADNSMSSVKTRYQSACDAFEIEKERVLSQPPWRYAPVGCAAWGITYALWQGCFLLVALIAGTADSLNIGVDYKSVALFAFLFLPLLSWGLMKIGIGALIQRQQANKPKKNLQPLKHEMAACEKRVAHLRIVLSECEERLTAARETFGQQCIVVPLDDGGR